MYLLDTNAIIYYVKDENEVVSIIEDIYTKNVPVYVSAMTEAELFAFPEMSDEETERIEKFLQSVSIIPMDSQVARLTGSIRKKYQLKIADSVIAATALFTGTQLLTRNVNDFKRVSELNIQEI
jgi:predicted nucleic acid-binding protein